MSSSSFASNEHTEEPMINNRDEIYMKDFDKAIDDWKVSKMSYDQIYQMAKWKIFGKNDYVIATEEKNIPISNGLTTIKLLNNESIRKYAKEWNYMHIGLVQVGAKPLTRLGLDTSVLMVLRDARELEYERSIHATIETSLSNGPIQFECHPNATLGLRDKTIMNSLILQIKTHNYKMLEGALPMAIIYRMYFKLMKTAFGSKAYKVDRKGQTLLIQTDLSKSNVSIPKMI